MSSTQSPGTTTTTTTTTPTGVPNNAETRGQYSREEISALRGIFALYDPDGTGAILGKDLEGLLQKIGLNCEAAADVVQSFRVEPSAAIDFGKFLEIVRAAQPEQPGERPDPKVLEFLRILDQYRIKCESEGNYLEADRAYQQLELLRRQEEKRQRTALRARQLAERQDVQIAHNMQYTDFAAAWDKYLEEYDRMAQIYIQQMTERHAAHLLDFQKKLQVEVADKPPKWSRELLEWRRRQHMLARQKNYAEAQRIKTIANKLEEKERRGCEHAVGSAFARKEAQFRAQQQSELQALLKRIDARRKEHVKQRDLDSKRLMQRNRNVQAVLESKQSAETNATFQEIRRNLFQALQLAERGPPPTTTTTTTPGTGPRPSSNGADAFQQADDDGGGAGAPAPEAIGVGAAKIQPSSQVPLEGTA